MTAGRALGMRVPARLDTDILVVQAGSPAERRGLEEDPRLDGLDVVRDGRSLFVDGDLYDALQFSSLLSLPFLLDELPGRMAAALGGSAA